MADFDFDDFLDEVGRKLTDIASATAGEFRDDAIADGKALVAASRQSLDRRTKQLPRDEPTADQLSALTIAQSALAVTLAHTPSLHTTAPHHSCHLPRRSTTTP